MPEPPEPTTPAELPPARERAAIAALALAAFALNLNTLVLGALLPFLPAELVAPGDDQQLIAVAALCSAAAALAAGPLADRLGRKALLQGGMAVFVLASAMHAFAGSYGVLLAARALSGAAVGVAYASASALAAEIVPYRRRGAAMGAFTAGMFLALPIGLPLAWWFARSGHWHAIFWLQAGLGAAGLAMAARCVPAVSTDGVWGDPRQVLGRLPVLATLLAVMLHVGSFFTVVQLAPLWLDQPQLIPKEHQGWIWIWLGLGAAVGSFVFGRVSDRIGKRQFVLLTSVVLVVCFVLLARVETFAGLVPVGIALAIVAPARTGPLQALMSGLVPTRLLGTLMGLRACSMQLGVFLFAQFVRADGPGGFGAVLYAAAGCQVASYLAIRIGVRETAR
ncbi:MAG: MFS transporter [Planctomycetota bacterium]